MSIEYKGYTIEIEQDTDAQGPNEWEDGNGVLIVTTRNRYFDVTPNGWSANELDAIFKAAHTKKRLYTHDGAKYHVRPLYAYVHSGVALSLGRGGQFSDQWDSGLIGAVLIKVGVVGHGRKHGVQACATGLVETWNTYLSGDVWGYVITSSDGTELDACWGMYGHDYCKREAKEMVDHYVREAVKNGHPATIA